MNMKQDQNKCNHEWAILTPDNGEVLGLSECSKCDLWLHHSSRLQLEMNKHVFGFQGWISIITILISILALCVAAAAYFHTSNEKFAPLTQNQFNAEKGAGFSFDQIIKFEQIRKSN